MTVEDLHIGLIVRYGDDYVKVVAIDWVRKVGTLDKKQYKIGVQSPSGKVTYIDIESLKWL